MDTKETQIYIAALIAAAVLGVILIYFIVTMIRQQRKTRLLHLEKIHAEISAQENERKKIAADLHDDIGPLLSAIKFKINAVDLVHEEDKKIIEDTSKHIDDTLDLVRKISYDLLPNTLTRKGLIKAIEEFIARVEKMSTLKIRFVHDNFEDLPDEMKVNLYRIILEIVNNTMKHAHADRLEIELNHADNFIVLRTADNGVGFDFKKKNENNTGLGLRNLQSRTDIMNGDLKIETGPGKGVKYLIAVPAILKAEI